MYNFELGIYLIVLNRYLCKYFKLNAEKAEEMIRTITNSNTTNKDRDKIFNFGVNIPFENLVAEKRATIQNYYIYFGLDENSFIRRSQDELIAVNIKISHFSTCTHIQCLCIAAKFRPLKVQNHTSLTY